MNLLCRVLVLSLVSFLAGGWAQGARLQPELVSPGHSQKTVQIADHCPTFNWGSDVIVSAFELVVYQFSAEETPRSVSAEDVDPFLRVRLPGSARGWTPSLDHCLETGQSYAWTLRAVAEEGASKWAEPRMFTVSAGPTAAEVEVALDVLNLYLEGVQGGEEDPRGPQAKSDILKKRAKTSALEKSADDAVSDTDAPLGTGIAAIRGEVTDLTGETYGVEGISSSPEGAGLSAENTADATDLLLRGDGVAPDTELSESVLDRVSDSDQIFDIRNSGTGTMTLQVDGTDVVTTLTDSDTLGNLVCGPTQVAQWVGGAWTCANTGTDTLASLSCDPGQIVHWNGTVWVCGQPTLTYVSCSNSTSCTATCPASSIVWTSGCSASPGTATLIQSTPTSAGAGLPPSSWVCSAFNPLGAVTVTVDLYCVAQ